VAIKWNEMAKSSVAFIRGVFEPLEFCLLFSRPRLIWFRHVGQAPERRIKSYAVTWLWSWYSRNGRYNELYECAHNSGETVWDVWWKQWQWDRVFAECFGFPLSVLFHQCTIECIEYIMGSRLKASMHVSLFNPLHHIQSCHKRCAMLPRT